MDRLWVVATVPGNGCGAVVDAELGIDSAYERVNCAEFEIKHLGNLFCRASLRKVLQHLALGR